MTSTNSADHNDDLMPTQEKLEWVTPKISLMEGGDTDGKQSRWGRNESRWYNEAKPSSGPS
jgi:hypothetical protein